MIRASRILDYIWRLGAVIVVVPITWAIARLVRLGDWIERKQVERAARRAKPR